MKVILTLHFLSFPLHELIWCVVDLRMLYLSALSMELMETHFVITLMTSS